MKTYEEIEARRNELIEIVYENGETEETKAEWAKLYDEEMELNMENAEAIAKNDDVIIFIVSMFECGYAINSKIDGKWDYKDGYTAVEAMTKFAALARENGVKKCLVTPEWLDRKYLEELDAENARNADAEEYAEACFASACGNDRLLERYYRKHGIEEEYGPSNPWDAPGMSVRDFI